MYGDNLLQNLNYILLKISNGRIGLEQCSIFVFSHVIMKMSFVINKLKF